MIATEAKARFSPSDPIGHKHKAEQEQEKNQEQSEETPSGKQGEEGITPLAGEHLPFKAITNYSIAPGFAWFELTNTAAVTLAVGRVTVTGEMPHRGGGEYMTALFRLPQPEGRVVGQPVALLILNPTEITGGGLENTGMSIDGFPGTPKSLPATSAIPINAGVQSVVIDPAFNPPRVNIYFEVRTATSIPAGKRWLFMSMTGV